MFKGGRIAREHYQRLAHALATVRQSGCIRRPAIPQCAGLAMKTQGFIVWNRQALSGLVTRESFRTIVAIALPFNPLHS